MSVSQKSYDDLYMQACQAIGRATKLELENRELKARLKEARRLAGFMGHKPNAEYLREVTDLRRKNWREKP